MKASKLHGAGNDFLLLDGGLEPELEERLPVLVARLCHRQMGVGGDGVLLVTPHRDGEAQVTYWNSDGSLASFCANGTRCAARFAAVKWGWSEMVLHTGFAAVPARVAGAQVELGLPAPAAVHPWQELRVGGEDVRSRFLVVGVLEEDDSMFAAILGGDSAYVPFTVESRMADAPYVTSLAIS
ncbi:MAG TPA: hypothetical protein PKL08_09650, partial [Thermoanaerobaculaceae bacterium]|nr:hypothetical protein [Thermoanaerobaculaceae bacterium]